MRLHEWVAEEKGYFAKENLDFEYVEQLTKKNAKAQKLFKEFNQGLQKIIKKGTFKKLWKKYKL